MLSDSETTEFTKWLEDRLRDYFDSKWKGRRTNPITGKKDNDYNWFVSFLANKCNGGVPIDIPIFDFRILELKLESETKKPPIRKSIIPFHPSPPADNNNDLHTDHQAIALFDEDFNTSEDEFAAYSSKDEEQPYQQQNSHVFLIYRESSKGIPKELWLHMYASQYEHIHPNAFGDKKFSTKQYIIGLDDYQIDVYTKVIVDLKEWLVSKKCRGQLTFPTPECYYGRYQLEERKVGTKPVEDDIILVDDDIMSKVAAGMMIAKRERKLKEYVKHLKAPWKQSGYRLLILEDLYKAGFKQRTNASNSFLSLINVKEALKTLAMVHCISWSYGESQVKSLQKIWPFLDNSSYVSYITSKVLFGYPLMVGLVREYLQRRVSQGEEVENEARRLLDRLMKLKPRLREILDGARHSKIMKCLIHQDPSAFNFLFRYTVLSQQQKDEGNVPISLLGSESQGASFAQDKGLKREVMLINWRTATVGSPLIDVAFLLMTTLPPKTRRAETEPLLSLYWNTFRVFHQIT